MIALQYWAGFGCKVSQTSHIYMQSSLSLKPPSPTNGPLGCHRVPGSALSLAAASHQACFKHGGVYMAMLLSQFLPPSSSRTVSTRLFPISASPLLPTNSLISTIFSSFHIYALIYYICFSLCELLHPI